MFQLVTIINSIKLDLQELLMLYRKHDETEMTTTGLSLEAKLLLNIWTMSKQESFRQIDDTFGISHGYADYIFSQSCTKIVQIYAAGNLILWPSPPLID